MDIKKLDKFSRLMYELISANYPQWINSAKYIPGHEEAFMIEAVSPYGPQSNLGISTGNGAITLVFDYTHSHFGWSDFPTEAFSEARETINSILNEELLAAAELKDGKCIESTLFAASQLDEIIRNNPRYNRIVGWNYSYLTEGNE
jgi:hypothetical protein